MNNIQYRQGATVVPTTEINAFAVMEHEICKFLNNIKMLSMDEKFKAFLVIGSFIVEDENYALNHGMKLKMDQIEKMKDLFEKLYEAKNNPLKMTSAYIDDSFLNSENETFVDKTTSKLITEALNEMELHELYLTFIKSLGNLLTHPSYEGTDDLNILMRIIKNPTIEKSNEVKESMREFLVHLLNNIG